MSEPFRIGFVPGVSPGKWLRTWAQRLPHSPLESALVEVTDQRAVLDRREVDMCFVRLPLDQDGLHVIPLYAEVPVVVAAKDHPVAAFDELDVADLAGEHLLQDSAGCPEWAAVADAVRAGTRREPPPMTLPQAIEVAASGNGIVIVPMSLARLYQRKDVRYRPVTGVAQSRIGLAWPVDADDPRVETFIGIVRGRTVHSSRQPTSDDGGPAPHRTANRRGQGSGGTGRRGPAGPAPRRGRRRR